MIEHKQLTALFWDNTSHTFLTRNTCISEVLDAFARKKADMNRRGLIPERKAMVQISLNGLKYKDVPGPAF